MKNLITNHAKFIVALVGAVIVGVQSNWDWSVTGPAFGAAVALWAVPNTTTEGT